MSDTHQTYTYNEAHVAINAFMEGSGIRAFCTFPCRGGCCQACTNPCNGERRITCSLFICDTLRGIIFRSQKRYDTLKEYIDSIVVKLLIRERYNQVDWDTVNRLTPLDKIKWSIQSGTYEPPDSHYIPHSEWVREQAVFDQGNVNRIIALLWDDLTLNTSQIVALEIPPPLQRLQQFWEELKTDLGEIEENKNA